MTTVQKQQIYRRSATARLTTLYDMVAATHEADKKFAIASTHAEEIMSIKSDFYKAHNSIIGTTDDEQFDEQDEFRKEFDKMFFALKTLTFQQPQPSSSGTDSQAKLPKIHIPVFSGKWEEFQSFLEIFNSKIHSSPAIPTLDKYYHLISSLQGEALASIRHLPLTELNYMVAYNSLVKRYKNERQVVKLHVDAIVQAPRITTPNANNIRNLLDCFSKNLGALETCKLPKSLEDFLLFDLLLRKLDVETVTRFELQSNSNRSEIPTFKQLMTFLEQQWSAYQNVPAAKTAQTKPEPKLDSYRKYKQSFVTQTAAVASACVVCNGNHRIYKCETFLKYSPKERFAVVKDKNMCINCLGTQHNLKSCGSKSSCNTCQQNHHSLLHFGSVTMPASIGNVEPTEEPLLAATTGLRRNNSQKTVMLSTALVEVMGKGGKSTMLRALLDSGSQASFVTTGALNRLGLPFKRSSLEIQGIGASITKPILGSSMMNLKTSNNNRATVPLEVYILSKICSNVPSVRYQLDEDSPLRTLPLADPTYGLPGPIDLLLGAELFPEILSGDKKVGNPGEPTALATTFGYVLTGGVARYSSPSVSSHVMQCAVTPPEVGLESLVEKFWEVDSIPELSTVPSSAEDTFCEQHFASTVKRTPSGRIIVSYPFRIEKPIFVSSRSLAIRRFLALERRLAKIPETRELYNLFMKEYLESGHMERVDPSLTSPSTFYLPHHCVLRPESCTTKLRVVFNASACASPDASLNECLYKGPKLQRDIVSILLNFRTFQFVLITDIKMMYRNILIDPAQWDYQRIIYRFSTESPLEEFRLLTVTYGVSSSPYLAIRSLLEVARWGKARYPLAAKALESNTYMDDIVSGCNTVDELITLKDELIALLGEANFELRKWATNYEPLLDSLPPSYRALDAHKFEDKDNCTLNVLGLRWDSHSDHFTFKVRVFDRKCTKRNILSNLARVYDPLGFLTPCTLFLKHLIQRLWNLRLDWDAEAPADCARVWEHYLVDLPKLENLSLPRLLVPKGYTLCELHAFGDSSEKGYSAVLYFVFRFNSQPATVSFVCSKAKVAPLKSMTIPRLELCAAVLASKLIHYTVETLASALKFDQIFAWSDSKTVLSWLSADPAKWKTFVAHRVNYVQERVPFKHWHYIPSELNPADLGSRGLLPADLIQSSLWWAGPDCLREPQTTEQIGTTANSALTDVEAKIHCFLTHTRDQTSVLFDLLERHSSFPKLIRICCYIFRFRACKLPRDLRYFGPVIANEFHDCIKYLTRILQMSVFSSEIDALQTKSRTPKWFSKLSPFLDEAGVLRVGGRLSNAVLSRSRKYPMLLPCKHAWTTLLIRHVHESNFHAGQLATQNFLAQNYWIISARKAIRSVLAKCNACFQVRPKSFTPCMANLPAARVTPSKPFLHVGVDYAGPFAITMSRVRGAKRLKAYLCLFICFATKAVHLELASDLSSDAFLAALRRFLGRRGRCTHIYSDCGTNFVGANRMLQQYMQEAASKEYIKWHFNPPSAPHFGGLWESGVKAVKTHLLRTIGEQILTYEELSTLFVQVEAMLNSRPLTSISNDANDLTPLTPAHFLTFDSAAALPNDLAAINSCTPFHRWQYVQKLLNDLWKRWSHDYLHTLQQRAKWCQPGAPIELDTLVLVEDNLRSPLTWRLGRIVTLKPGSDGIVRVVDVRTQDGLLSRPVVKLCPLPTQ